MNLQLLFAYDMIIHLGTTEQKNRNKKALVKWAVTHTKINTLLTTYRL